jgi:hypothetical protein
MVGETMIQSWRDHVREAARLIDVVRRLRLRLTPGPDADRAKAISHLYDAVVEITQALNKLETRDDN